MRMSLAASIVETYRAPQHAELFNEIAYSMEADKQKKTHTIRFANAAGY